MTKHALSAGVTALVLCALVTTCSGRAYEYYSSDVELDISTGKSAETPITTSYLSDTSEDEEVQEIYQYARERPEPERHSLPDIYADDHDIGSENDYFGALPPSFLGGTGKGRSPFTNPFSHSGYDSGLSHGILPHSTPNIHEISSGYVESDAHAQDYSPFVPEEVPGFKSHSVAHHGPEHYGGHHSSHHHSSSPYDDHHEDSDDHYLPEYPSIHQSYHKPQPKHPHHNRPFYFNVSYREKQPHGHHGGHYADQHHQHHEYHDETSYHDYDDGGYVSHSPYRQTPLSPVDHGYPANHVLQHQGQQRGPFPGYGAAGGETPNSFPIEFLSAGFPDHY